MVVVTSNNQPAAAATEEVEEIVQTKIVQVLAFILSTGELLVMFYLWLTSF